MAQYECGMLSQEAGLMFVLLVEKYGRERLMQILALGKQAGKTPEEAVRIIWARS